MRSDSSGASLLWADRTDSVSDLPPLTGCEWEDSEDNDPATEAESPEGQLPEEVSAHVNSCFTSLLSWTARQSIKKRYQIPDTLVTRTPKIDKLFTSQDSKFNKDSEAKQIDKDILSTQGYALDVALPLMALLGEVDGGTLNLTDVKGIAKDALELLGNAVGQASRIRRKRILKACNPYVVPLADQEDLFQDAAPFLFGKDFEVHMKDRAEVVKILNQSQRMSKPSKPQFFQKGRSSQAQGGGGYSYRGGRTRFTPWDQGCPNQREV